jgi:hypothetical protein
MCVYMNKCNYFYNATLQGVLRQPGHCYCHSEANGRGIPRNSPRQAGFGQTRHGWIGLTEPNGLGLPKMAPVRPGLMGFLVVPPRNDMTCWLLQIASFDISMVSRVGPVSPPLG